VIPTLSGVHQDIRVVPPDEVGVRPYGVGKHLGGIPRLALGLRTLESEFTPVLGEK